MESYCKNLIVKGWRFNKKSFNEKVSKQARNNLMQSKEEVFIEF